MPRTDFKDTLADEILDLLKTNMQSAGFKAFFLGDPLAIPQTMMPCCIVEFEQTAYSVATTAQDDVFHTISVRIVFNKKDDFGKKPDEVAGHRRLHELAEGVDASTGETSQSSVVGILRKNFTLGEEADDQTITVQYGLTPRPRKEDIRIQDSLTEEANIRAVIRQLTTVTNRT